MIRKRLACAMSAMAIGWVCAAAHADDKYQPIPIDQKMAASAPAGAPGHSAFADCQDADHGCDETGLYAEFGLYYLKPYWKSNPAFFTSSFGVGARTISERQQDFSVDPRLAPHAAIGITSCDGLGARIRWSQFENTGFNENLALGINTAASPAGQIAFEAFAGPGTNLFTSGSLRTQLWDFEVTQECHACNWLLIGAAGIRVGRVSQDYSAANLNTTGVPISLFESGHSFDGIGPTLAVEAHRAIGCGGFGLYASARGSILFGHAKETANLVVPRQGEQIATPSADWAASREDVLPIAELELGAEYVRCLGHAHLFVQAGLIGQVWFAAGNSSNTDGNLSALVEVPVPVTGRNTDLGFFGLNLSAGIRY